MTLLSRIDRQVTKKMGQARDGGTRDSRSQAAVSLSDTKYQTSPIKSSNSLIIPNIDRLLNDTYL